ncbi:hypothetical protein [Burkholderia ubonensis]|uniref:hypothetical protein n=1 Tax=Burkholderia ubonensis TaxID=101571 RepID=UPI0012F708D5|nr:hypothetical protein [Burkholderia ubonensis]
MLADTGRPWQAPAAAKALAAAGKRGGGPVAPMRRSAEARRSVNTLPRHSHPRPGLGIESGHARIATSGKPRCADKRIPLHDERHRRCVAAFRARLPMPQAISGRHSHAHSRAAARNSVVKMSAPRRRERNIPQRLSSEMPALPSGMPRRSRVPARIRAASIIQQMKRLRALGSCDLHRKFVKKRVSPMTPHSRIHSTARPRNAIGFHPRKTRVQAVNPTHPAISCAQQ